jgi:hypothetical protein
LRGHKASPFEPAIRQRREVEFLQHDVYPRPRKILEATGVIKIQMGKNDVTYIINVKTHAMDLIYRGKPMLQLNVIECSEKTAQALRMLDVLLAESGVRQDQAIGVGFDQNTVTHHRRRQSTAVTIEQSPTPRAHTSAI